MQKDFHKINVMEIEAAPKLNEATTALDLLLNECFPDFTVMKTHLNTLQTLRPQLRKGATRDFEALIVKGMISLRSTIRDDVATSC
eukprot:6835914-Alexandrium_andersonii.AAC.1